MSVNKNSFIYIFNWIQATSFPLLKDIFWTNSRVKRMRHPVNGNLTLKPLEEELHYKILKLILSIKLLRTPSLPYFCLFPHNLQCWISFLTGQIVWVQKKCACVRANRASFVSSLIRFLLFSSCWPEERKERTIAQYAIRMRKNAFALT